MPIDTAEHLRRRAGHLRRLADTIDSTPATRLEHLAGDDTWRGPRPSLCAGLLRQNLVQLHRAADELRWQAYVFERRAEALGLLAG